MSINLDHMVIASAANETAAHRFAEIMGLTVATGKALTASSYRFA